MAHTHTEGLMREQSSHTLEQPWEVAGVLPAHTSGTSAPDPSSEAVVDTAVVAGTVAAGTAVADTAVVGTAAVAAGTVAGTAVADTAVVGTAAVVASCNLARVAASSSLEPSPEPSPEDT